MSETVITDPYDSDDEPVSAIATAYSNLKNNLLPMPDVLSSKLSRIFELDEIPNGIDITSVDITSHGCSVLIGCSNGIIMLLDLTSSNSSKKGYVVGHIRAKGMHTNLLLTVKITEDCRFGFAGVMKGSMEMLAIDLSSLPLWSTKRRFTYRELISTSNHLDSKLRGFGAVTRVMTPSGADHAEYRLLCGKGIKNIHVWSFIPEAAQGSKATWTCIYDVPTNGNTIETMSFRCGGDRVLTKSAGMCIRVWNLTESVSLNGNSTSGTPSSESSTLLSKPTYEDIPNSQDTRTILGDVAYGGTYDFAAIRVSSGKDSNRCEFEIPARATETDEGQRRKRMMRQIKDIAGSQDGAHAIIQCTDGSFFYYHQNYPNLCEIMSLQREPEAMIAWAVSRIGRAGVVVLLKGEFSPNLQKTVVTISLLPDIGVDHPGANEVLPRSYRWFNWGCYYTPYVPISGTNIGTPASNVCGTPASSVNSHSSDRYSLGGSTSEITPVAETLLRGSTSSVWESEFGSGGSVPMIKSETSNGKAGNRGYPPSTPYIDGSSVMVSSRHTSTATGGTSGEGGRPTKSIVSTSSHKSYSGGSVIGSTGVPISYRKSSSGRRHVTPSPSTLVDRHIETNLSPATDEVNGTAGVYNEETDIRNSNNIQEGLLYSHSSIGSENTLRRKHKAVSMALDEDTESQEIVGHSFDNEDDEDAKDRLGQESLDGDEDDGGNGDGDGEIPESIQHNSNRIQKGESGDSPAREDPDADTGNTNGVPGKVKGRVGRKRKVHSVIVRAAMQKRKAFAPYVPKRFVESNVVIMKPENSVAETTLQLLLKKWQSTIRPSAVSEESILSGGFEAYRWLCQLLPDNDDNSLAIPRKNCISAVLKAAGVKQDQLLSQFSAEVLRWAGKEFRKYVALQCKQTEHLSFWGSAKASLQQICWRYSQIVVEILTQSTSELKRAIDWDFTYSQGLHFKQPEGDSHACLKDSRFQIVFKHAYIFTAIESFANAFHTILLRAAS